MHSTARTPPSPPIPTDPTIPRSTLCFIFSVTKVRQLSCSIWYKSGPLFSRTKFSTPRYNSSRLSTRLPSTRMVATALCSFCIVWWKYAAGTESGVALRFFMVILRVCGRNGVCGVIGGEDDLVMSMTDGEREEGDDEGSRDMTAWWSLDSEEGDEGTVLARTALPMMVASISGCPWSNDPHFQSNL